MARGMRRTTAGVLALLIGVGAPAFAACPGTASGNSTVHLTAARWTYGVWNSGNDTGHFDERAARTCRDASSRSVNGGSNWAEDSYQNRTLTALHVLAVCFGQIDTLGNCEESAATSCNFDAVIIPDLPNGQTSAWIKRADGTVDVWLSPNDIVGYE